MGVKESNPVPFLDLPEEMQRLVLRYIPLRQFAQLACLRKELRMLYLERVGERDVVVAAVLKSHFTAEFSEGLTDAQIALPRDLLVQPEVRASCNCAAAQLQLRNTSHVCKTPPPPTPTHTRKEA